jgi:hypothetical protein
MTLFSLPGYWQNRMIQELYSFQDKDIGCIIRSRMAKKGLSPPCCLPKIIILKAIWDKGEMDGVLIFEESGMV